MKILRLALFTFIGFSIFAEQRNYFGSDNYSQNTELPVSYNRDYYDQIFKEKNLTQVSFSEWFNGPHFTANWDGTRSMFEDYGILPVITYLGNFAGNPDGGMRQGITNTSSIHLGLGIDLQRLTKIDSLSGWSLGNTWVWRFGKSLSQNYINNEFNVQQNFGSQTIQMQSLFLLYSKDFCNQDYNFIFKLGRFAAGDNFMTKPIYWLYMNNAIDGNPVGVFKQTKWSAYPASTWGAFSRISHKNGIYGKLGVYQINSIEQDSKKGFDFSFSKADGVNLNAEIGWDINHDDSGLNPGNISAGYVSDWYNAIHNDDPSKYSSYNCSIYIQADYMIWNMGSQNRENPKFFGRTKNDQYRDLRGIVLWGVIQYDPYDNLAQMPLFINGGFLFNAPLESRADDVLCFGLAYGKYSGKLNSPEKNSYEMMIELNYKIQVNRFLFVQPVAEYIINTKGGQYPNAIVLGAQFGASF